MEELKEKISDDLEAIQNKVDAIGFKGSNEYNLYLRESILDYIIVLSTELLKNQVNDKLDEILSNLK